MLRVLMVIALAVLAVMPPHVHAAPAAVHHGISADHAHAHGPDQGETPDRHRQDLATCCASISLQCGSPALAGDGHWTPIARLPVDIEQGREQRACASGSVPEFEPPPPRI